MFTSFFQAEPTWKNGGPLGWQLQINQATGLMPEVVSGNTHAAYLWRLKMNRLLVLPWLYLKGSYYSMIDKELNNVYGSIQSLAGKDSYIIGVIYFSLNWEEGYCKCSQETRCVLLALLDIRHLCFPGFASQRRRHQQKNLKMMRFSGLFWWFAIKKWSTDTLRLVFECPPHGSVGLALLNWPPQKTKVWLMVDMTHEHAGILYVIYVYIYICHICIYILYYIILYYIILYYIYIILYYIILYYIILYYIILYYICFMIKNILYRLYYIVYSTVYIYIYHMLVSQLIHFHCGMSSLKVPVHEVRDDRRSCLGF